MHSARESADALGVERPNETQWSAKAVDAFGIGRPKADVRGVQRPNNKLSSVKAADALRERLNADAERVPGGVYVVVTEPLLGQRSSSGKAADVLAETICGNRTSQTFRVRER